MKVRCRRGPALAALTLCALVVLGGCWSRRELNERAFAVGVGVDAAERDRVKVTVQVIKPKFGGGPPDVWLASAVGPTVEEAAAGIATLSGRQIFLAHAKLLVIGEAAARRGVATYLDYFERSNQFRRRSLLVVAKGASAREFLEARHGQESIPALGVVRTVISQAKSGRLPRVTLNDFVRQLAQEGSAYAPGGELVGKTGNKPGEVRVRNLAVFRGDRLAGWFTPRETTGLLFALGQGDGAEVTVRCPQAQDQYLVLGLNRVRARIVPAAGRARRCRLLITASARIDEQVCKVDLRSARAARQIETAAAKAMAREVLRAVEAAKRLDADVFGFGRTLAASSFSQIAVEPVVTVTLRQTGMVELPLLASRRQGK